MTKRQKFPPSWGLRVNEIKTSWNLKHRKAAVCKSPCHIWFVGIPSSFQFFTLSFILCSWHFFDIQNGRVWRKLWETESIISSLYQGFYLTRHSAFYFYSRTLSFVSNQFMKGVLYECVCIRGRHGAVSFLSIITISFKGNKERNFEVPLYQNFVHLVFVTRR